MKQLNDTQVHVLAIIPCLNVAILFMRVRQAFILTRMMYIILKTTIIFES
jgi:hypothetical protein